MPAKDASAVVKSAVEAQDLLALSVHELVEFRGGPHSQVVAQINNEGLLDPWSSYRPLTRRRFCWLRGPVRANCDIWHDLLQRSGADKFLKG